MKTNIGLIVSSLLDNLESKFKSHLLSGKKNIPVKHGILKSYKLMPQDLFPTAAQFPSTLYFCRCQFHSSSNFEAFCPPSSYFWSEDKGELKFVDILNRC